MSMRKLVLVVLLLALKIKKDFWDWSNNQHKVSPGGAEQLKKKKALLDWGLEQDSFFYCEKGRSRLSAIVSSKRDQSNSNCHFPFIEGNFWNVLSRFLPFIVLSALGNPESYPIYYPLETGTLFTLQTYTGVKTAFKETGTIEGEQEEEGTTLRGGCKETASATSFLATECNSLELSIVLKEVSTVSFIANKPESGSAATCSENMP